MKAISLAVAGLLLAAGAPAHAQSVAEFYKGKTIRMVVGIDVGSGYDVNARLLAKHIVNHIPGNPSIVVQNQPGAGSANMTAQMYANGPFDGTVIGAAFAGLPTYPLFTPAAATRFDLTKLNWLGNTNRETHVTYVWHKSPVQSFEEIRTTQLIMGAQAPGSSQVDFPLTVNALFGFKHKVITGYGSTAKINLAMESGEVDGALAALTSVRALSSQWLAEKKIKIITQWGLRPNPDLPGVPNAFDLAKTDDDRAAMQLVMARLDVGRPFFLPQNVPADRVAALRAAFDATMKDKAFLAEADKLKIDVDAMNGADLATFVAQILKTPPETVARVRKALETK
ncbi:MAG TPA: tripartite tricarboxylate transporter substrate-binding protein [Xanthobacteraceae bacterium]|nr:tripartite tricarboxylate transporter substrate-binding protein [Xanthobacteraceae bacterium]